MKSNSKKSTHNKSHPIAAVRGKYAAAFKNKGVKVTVHSKDGDRTQSVKRTADGKIVWIYSPAKTARPA